MITLWSVLIIMTVYTPDIERFSKICLEDGGRPHLEASFLATIKEGSLPITILRCKGFKPIPKQGKAL